ncbi:glycerophosphodiester phosphodiesterase 1-like [Watersipora subatra]|uniref:glycerophosphodiester phosphodiesterase 1-like n=1 Tax=Watersipora subatra TaxID=2589382 RepID=UPI00355C5E6F
MKARKTDDLFWNRLKKDVTIIGHRGCSLNAPENTIEAVQEAHKRGVKAVEFDIVLTRDNEPVVIHDFTVDRTTDGSGQVGEMTWAEIKDLDAPYKYTGPGSYNGVKVPHLKNMLKECKKHGLRAFLDIKGSQPFMMARAIGEMAKEFPDLHEWAVVCSFYPQALIAMKWQYPQFSTILTFRPHVLTLKDPDGPERNSELWKKIAAPIADYFLDLTIHNFWWYFCGANGFFMQEQEVSVSQLKYWRRRGMDVFVWTVNSPATKEYLRHLKVPYITDDCSG